MNVHIGRYLRPHRPSVLALIFIILLSMLTLWHQKVGTWLVVRSWHLHLTFKQLLGLLFLLLVSHIARHIWHYSMLLLPATLPVLYRETYRLLFKRVVFLLDVFVPLNSSLNPRLPKAFKCLWIFLKVTNFGAIAQRTNIRIVKMHGLWWSSIILVLFQFINLVLFVHIRHLVDGDTCMRRHFDLLHFIPGRRVILKFPHRTNSVRDWSFDWRQSTFERLGIHFTEPFDFEFVRYCVH